MAVLAVFSEAYGHIKIEDSEVNSIWDAVAVTAEDAFVEIKNSMLKQTYAGWNFARRGAAVG